MSKVTSKLQVTIPKVVAVQYRIRPGDEVEFVPAGDVIRLECAGDHAVPLEVAERLELFDEATRRQRRRDRIPPKGGQDRGWTREELYQRGGSR